MKIKDYKCKCGHNDFFFADKNNQKGIYCTYCGRWLKWADKDEQNLTLKQKPILDKIRADILERSFEVPYENQAFDYGIRLVKLEDVEHILDTYKEE